MSDIDGIREFYGLVKKPKLSAKEERIAGDILANIRGRQIRERKEKLYSYPSSVKSRNTLP